MRLVPLLGLIVVLAACGSAADRPDGRESPGQESVPAETDVATTPVDESALKPPAILLRSSAGDQKAVQGSFCVAYVDPVSGHGGGICRDTEDVHAKAITVAQPGDELTFRLSGAELVRPSGCHAEDEQGCIGYVHVKPLGCERPEVERVPLALGPETRWTIDLDRGAYELDFFGYFESSEGATGDVSGALGLLVGGGPKDRDYRGVVAVERAMQVCAFRS